MKIFNNNFQFEKNTGSLEIMQLDKIELNFRDEYILSLSPRDDFVSYEDDYNILIDNVLVQVRTYDEPIFDGDKIRISYNDLKDLSKYTISIGDETHNLEEYIRIALTLTVKIKQEAILFSDCDYDEEFYVTDYCKLGVTKDISLFGFEKQIVFELIGIETQVNYTWEQTKPRRNRG